MNDDVSGGPERIAERDDVVPTGIADEQADMKGAHAAKVARDPARSQRPRGRTGRRGRFGRAPLPSGAPVTTPLDLATLAAGDELHHPLLLLDVVVRGGEHPRTTLVVGNRTGRIETAPFWAGRDEMIRGFAKGMIVQVVGRVTAYRDALQLETTSLRALPAGSIPLTELAPSVGPVDGYWRYLDELRAKLPPRLRDTVALLYGDDAFRVRYEACPGAPGTGHHAALGGLLQHTCEVVRIGQQIAKVARADEALVIAGAMLHDIGKLESYSWETGVFDTTERGRLMGHVVAGVLMLRDAFTAAPAPTCTDDERLLLEHLILSHHGQLEFGAPVRPLTLEAEILHFADDASAKTASIQDALRSPELFPGDARVSSRRVWQLDNRWLVRLTPDFGREAGDAKDEAADQTS